MPHAAFGTRLRLLLLTCLGALLGLIGSRFIFVNSALSLIPWGASSFLIGYSIRPRQSALVSAGVFGFALATAFMLFGYQGAESVITRLPAFCLLGLVGAVCAITLGAIGNFIRKKVQPPPR